MPEQPLQQVDNHIILDDEGLKKALLVQIEYYFSEANLQKGLSSWKNRRVKMKWLYLRLHTTHALDFWYCKRYSQYQVRGLCVGGDMVLLFLQFLQQPVFLSIAS